MLGTGARYAEYGITGGFFLLTQTLFLGLADKDILVRGAGSFGGLLSAIVGEMPPLAQPAIQSLLVAMALLSVFIIGLVLEIIGSVFMFGEASAFREQLRVNQWIPKYIQAELADNAEDYRQFLDLTDKKNNTYWKRFKEAPWWHWVVPLAGPAVYSYQRIRRVQRPFRRLEFGLLAKVLTSGAKTEMLTDQISICRMSRGIATALYAGGLEVVALPSWFLYKSLAIPSSGDPLRTLASYK